MTTSQSTPMTARRGNVVRRWWARLMYRRSQGRTWWDSLAGSFRGAFW